MIILNRLRRSTSHASHGTGGGGSHTSHPNQNGPVTPVGPVTPHPHPDVPVTPHPDVPTPHEPHTPTLTPSSTSRGENAHLSNSVEPAPNGHIDPRKGMYDGYGRGAVIRNTAAAAAVVATTTAGIYFGVRGYNDAKSTGLRILDDVEKAAIAAKHRAELLPGALIGALEAPANSLEAALAAAEGLPGSLATGLGGTTGLGGLTKLTSSVTTVLAIGVAVYGAYEIYRFSRWI